MKKSILFIGLTAALLSCKKKETSSFTATDVTGNTVVEGVATKQIGGNVTPLAGADVTVRIKNSGAGGLYPSSSVVGSEVYSGKTNAMGKYSISVKTNGTGVNSEITFKGFSATNDTALSSILYDFPTAVYTPVLYKGVNITQNNVYVGTPLVTPSNQGVGTATVSGILYINRPKFATAANVATSLTTSLTPLPNQMIYLEYDKDPMTLTKKIYSVTTDANGRYSFIVTTPNQNVVGFAKLANLYTNDLATTADTLYFSSGSKVGKPGVYSGASIVTVGGVYSTANKNNNPVTYGGFTPNP